MKELDDLLNKNPMSVLLNLYDQNPQSVLNQFKTKTWGENTFFLSMLREYNNSEFRSSLLDFVLSINYDLKANFISDKKHGHISHDFKVNQPKEIKEKNIPEWFMSLEYLPEEASIKLVDVLGKDFVVSNAQKYNILDYAYSKKKIGLIKKFNEFGLNEENTFNGSTIKKLVMLDKNLFNVYSSLKKVSDPNKEFELIRQRFNGLLEEANRASYNKKEKVQEACLFLEEKFPILNQEQKETLVMDSVDCVTTSVYARGVNLMGFSKVSYKPKYVTDWAGMKDNSTHEFLYLFIEKAIPLSAVAHDNTKFFTLFTRKLNDLKVAAKGYNDRSSQARRNKAIEEKIAKLMTPEFMFIPVDEAKDKTHLWYHEIINDVDALGFFMSKGMDLSLLKVFKLTKDIKKQNEKDDESKQRDLISDFNFEPFVYNSNNDTEFTKQNIDNYIKLLKATALKPVIDDNGNKNLSFVFSLRKYVEENHDINSKDSDQNLYFVRVKSYCLSFFRELLPLLDMPSVSSALTQEEKDMVIYFTFSSSFNNLFNDDNEKTFKKIIFELDIVSEKALYDIKKDIDAYEGKNQKCLNFKEDFNKFYLTKVLEKDLSSSEIVTKKIKI